MDKLLSDRYQLLEQLGEGGFGAVFRAIDTRLERQVAVKILKRELATSDDMVERFMREAKLTASLSHPHSLRVFDYGHSEGLLYIVTELLHGTTLDLELKSRGTFSERWVLDRLPPVCLALEEAHLAGVIHRDLKPSNLFLQKIGQEERLIVIDFGISKGEETKTEKITKTGQLFGTPQYMSPEQIQTPNKVTPSSDLYSLGVIIFELLSGETPFKGDTLFEILNDQINTIPPKLSENVAHVSEEFVELVRQLLEKFPPSRPKSASAVAERLVTLSKRVDIGEDDRPVIRDTLGFGEPPSSSSNDKVSDPYVLDTIDSIAASLQRGSGTQNMGNQEGSDSSIEPSKRMSQRSTLVYAFIISFVISVLVFTMIFRGTETPKEGGRTSEMSAPLQESTLAEPESKSLDLGMIKDSTKQELKFKNEINSQNETLERLKDPILEEVHSEVADDQAELKTSNKKEAAKKEPVRRRVPQIKQPKRTRSQTIRSSSSSPKSSVAQPKSGSVKRGAQKSVTSASIEPQPKQALSASPLEQKKRTLSTSTLTEAKIAQPEPVMKEVSSQKSATQRETLVDKPSSPQEKTPKVEPKTSDPPKIETQKPKKQNYRPPVGF